MRKSLTFLIVLLVLIMHICFVPAISESLPAYSVDAADYFCRVWNDYYTQNGINIRGGYILNDDNKTIKDWCISYNGDHQVVNYSTGLIPSTSNIYMLYEPKPDIYGFCVFSDNMKSDLQKATIYSDKVVIDDAIVGSSHSPQDMWSITLNAEDALALLPNSDFTLRVMIDGKTEIVDISYHSQPYIYEMFLWLIRAQLYTDTEYERYASAEFLPEGSKSEIQDQQNSNTAYSFREDLDGIDAAANSVFYVTVLDNKLNMIGTATGFVAFDEHLFITNQHVIQDASYLVIEGEDESIYRLDKVIASDKTHDIAILLFPDGTKYRSLVMKADEELKRGQPVVTIGNPIGYRGTVAYGNISAFPAITDYDNLKCIQFTAPISHGSSGGCLFDDQGYVIGITTANGVSSFSGELGNDIGLAIPAKVVQDLYSQWDKQSFETLGTRKSWDTVGFTTIAIPSANPFSTAKPTQKPTLKPIIKPIEKPTATPTSKPTQKPTTKPTRTPTVKPTATPTQKPTAKPTPKPAPVPTQKPSSAPTASPTPTPTPPLIHFDENAEYKIVLSETEIVLFPNDTKQIKASVESLTNTGKKKASLIWSSADETIATVSTNGTIKAVSPGAAVIKCRSAEDENNYSILFVHVIQPVTGLSLTDSSVALVQNDNKQKKAFLTPVIEPKDAYYQTLEWSSSNPKVVTVNQKGELEAVGPGTATITVVTAKNAAKKVYKATCKVTVTVKVEEIFDINTNYELYVGKTITLKPTMHPQNATNKKLKWESTKNTIATVDKNGTVKGIKQGSCNIICSSEDGSIIKKYTVSVKIPVTSIKSKGNYYCHVGDNVNLKSCFEIKPANATEELVWEIENIDSVAHYRPQTKDGHIMFKIPGLFKVTVKAKNNSKIHASFQQSVLPEDGNTLSISDNCYGQWDNYTDDQLKIRIEVENKSYGKTIKAFELYAYATDTWGNRIYGEKTIYYLTTDKNVPPGKKVYSDYFILPSRSQIAKVYFAIHKVKLWDGSVVTIEDDDIHYLYWTIKK